MDDINEIIESLELILEDLNDERYNPTLIYDLEKAIKLLKERGE